jgi:hypothetical protein
MDINACIAIVLVVMTDRLHMIMRSLALSGLVIGHGSQCRIFDIVSSFSKVISNTLVCMTFSFSSFMFTAIALEQGHLVVSSIHAISQELV